MNVAESGGIAVVRGFVNVDEVVEKLAEGRRGLIQVCREAKINSPEYQAAGTAIDAVDDVVETLTGDRALFWEKGSGTGICC